MGKGELTEMHAERGAVSLPSRDSEATGDVRKLPCNSCGVVKNDILFVRKTDGEIQLGIFRYQEILVAECRGCGSISLWVRDLERKHVEAGSTDSAVDQVVAETWHPPRVLRSLPEWVGDLDPFLQDMYKETYGALQFGALRLAAMGARALLEHVMIAQVGDEGGFGAKLKKLVSENIISERQKEYLESALEVGHASIHRSHVPSTDDARSLFDIVDAVVNIVCVVGAKSQKLAIATPADPRRKAATS